MINLTDSFGMQWETIPTFKKEEFDMQPHDKQETGRPTAWFKRKVADIDDPADLRGRVRMSIYRALLHRKRKRIYVSVEEDIGQSDCR